MELNADRIPFDLEAEPQCHLHNPGTARCCIFTKASVDLRSCGCIKPRRGIEGTELRVIESVVSLRPQL